jgi:hypothetical protein
METAMQFSKSIAIGLLTAGAGMWIAPSSASGEAADPFSGGSKSIELDGIVTVRKVWDGRAQLEEIETDGPNGHWEGLTLFLYDPAAHQWRQSFVNSEQGVLAPPLVGSFKNGRGALFASDTFKDRSILVRGVWSDIKSDSHHYEESYSGDGGKTWMPAFIADLSREKP